MEKRWEEIAEIGIVFPKLYPKALSDEKEFLISLSQILQDPFFTAVEMSYMKDDGMRRLAIKYLQKSGVEVLFNGGDAFRQLNIDLSSLDSSVREKSIENARMLMDHCYEMGAKIFHIVTGKYTGEEERKSMLNAFAGSARELCRYAGEQAKDYVLTVSLETGDRYFDRKYLLGPTHEAVALVNKVREDYDNFGLLLDQSHFPVMQEDEYKALWTARDVLTHVHLGNSLVKDKTSPYFGDKHLPFGVPGSEIGVDRLTKFLKTLREIGFFTRPKATRKPVISFEVGAYDGEEAALVIANIKRVFFEAWYRA